MKYYFNKRISGINFEEGIEIVTDELTKEGFGVLTQIDVQATLKKKLDVGFRPYLILGACNPPFAYKALLAESKIGTMLPCNVIVEEDMDGYISITAVDPLASMKAIENENLREVAMEIRTKLMNIIDRL
jgi:uncharacterized protein (DUF302 family)